MQSLGRLLPILPVMLLLVLLSGTPLYAWLDQQFYDLIGRHYPLTESTAEKVVLIDIDQESVAQSGGWPLSRALHARAIRMLGAAGATSITYNLAFVEPDESERSADAELLSSIQESGRVVLPLIVEQGQERLPLAPDSPQGAHLAHADLPLDSDGSLRRHFLWAGIAYPRWPSLPVATLQLYPELSMTAYPGLRTPYLHIGFNGRWSRDYQLLLPPGLTRQRGTLVRFSLLQLLSDQIDPSEIRGRAVFVGLNDKRIEAPVSVAGQAGYSSTQVQALIFSALQQRSYLSPTLPLWSEILGLVVSCSLGLLLLMRLSTAVKWALGAVVVAGVLLPLGLIQQGYWLSMLPTLFGIAGVSCAGVLSRYAKKRKSPE